MAGRRMVTRRLRGTGGRGVGGEVIMAGWSGVEGLGGAVAWVARKSGVFSLVSIEYSLA